VLGGGTARTVTSSVILSTSWPSTPRHLTTYRVCRVSLSVRKNNHNSNMTHALSSASVCRGPLLRPGTRPRTRCRPSQFTCSTQLSDPKESTELNRAHARGRAPMHAEATRAPSKWKSTVGPGQHQRGGSGATCATTWCLRSFLSLPVSPDSPRSEHECPGAPTQACVT
jgi:hypothetical protein